MFAATRLATSALLVLLGPIELEPAEPPERLAADEVFVGDGAELTAAGKDALALWIAWLKAKPDLVATVEVHTDSRGDAKANLATSRARADAIVAHLRAGGVPMLRAIASPRGENTPLADNSTAAGRARNRRIEIRTRTLAEVQADLARILDRAKAKPSTDTTKPAPAARPKPPPAPGAKLLATGKKVVSTKAFGAWTARRVEIGRRVGDANAAFDVAIRAGQNFRNEQARSGTGPR